MALHRRARTAGTAIALSPHLGAEVKGGNTEFASTYAAGDSTAILHRALPCSVRSERLLHRTSTAGDEVAA